MTRNGITTEQIRQMNPNSVQGRGLLLALNGGKPAPAAADKPSKGKRTRQTVQYHIDSFTVTMPIITISEANRFTHIGDKIQRKMKQRDLTKSMVEGITSLMFNGQWFRITITRLGPRTLDDDNLAYSQKAVRDGIALALSVDDGSDRLEWVYMQEKNKAYGVRVKIEALKHAEEK